MTIGSPETHPAAWGQKFPHFPAVEVKHSQRSLAGRAVQHAKTRLNFDEDEQENFIRQEDRQGFFLCTFWEEFRQLLHATTMSQTIRYSRLLADFPSVGGSIILTVRFLEKGPLRAFLEGFMRG